MDEEPESQVAAVSNDIQKGCFGVLVISFIFAGVIGAAILLFII